MINERASDNGQIVHLLRQRLFGRKTEQTGDAQTPQLPLFDEAESLAAPLDEAGDEEVVAPTKHRGKRRPLPADLPRIEVVHELPEHESDYATSRAQEVPTRLLDGYRGYVITDDYAGYSAGRTGRRGAVGLLGARTP